MLEGTSEDRLAQPTPLLKAGSSTVCCPWLSTQVLTVSKDGDYTTFLGNLFEYSTILSVKILLMTWALSRTTL